MAAALTPRVAEAKTISDSTYIFHFRGECTRHAVNVCVDVIDPCSYRPGQRTECKIGLAIRLTHTTLKLKYYQFFSVSPDKSGFLSKTHSSMRKFYFLQRSQLKGVRRRYNMSVWIMQQKSPNQTYLNILVREHDTILYITHDVLYMILDYLLHI